MNKLRLVITVVAVLAFGGVARAATAITESFTFSALNLAVPDGNPAGLANHQTITSSIASIDSVVLTLSLNGSYNGDLYAYVTHGPGFSVLFNRPGKTPGSPFGYDDAGFTVTLDDSAANDIHTYRDSVTPGAGTPLSGIWQPDGRNVDPDIVTSSSGRGAMLSTFNTASASGEWTLFLADMSMGETHSLESWSLSITGTPSPIPEPCAALLSIGGLVALTFRRKRLFS